MPGGIVMAVILIVLFPIAVIMSCCAVAYVLGTLLTSDAEARNEGSELIELNRWARSAKPNRRAARTRIHVGAPRPLVSPVSLQCREKLYRATRR